MSYLVPKNIPNCCAYCPYNYSSLVCKITKSEIDRDDEYRERLEDCPLIEIKTPHGRLGDLDALWDKMSNYTDNEGAKMPFGDDDTTIHRDSVCFIIEQAETIIEREE